MSTTPAQRQASLKARRKAAGLVQVKVWVHPDWREHLKREASQMQSAPRASFEELVYRLGLDIDSNR